MVGGDAGEPRLEQVAAPFDIALEIAGAPEMLERGGCGDEGVVVAAEGAIMLARRPLVEFGAQQGQRKGQAHARQRFRQRHDVGGEAHILERSEEHTSELQSLMRISYAVFCLKKKKKTTTKT